MNTHTYATHLVWEGSTGQGYRAYSRDHQAVARPAEQEIQLSADPHFRGEAHLLNPEQLLVMAASSCQLLSFLAVAARNGIDVLDYEDAAHGEMPEDQLPMRITRITLAPVIRVAAGSDHAAVRKMVDEAHEGCYIANSLNSEIVIDATILDV